jgi:16S rRNA (cytosine967-C5)-methyltransferase
VPAHAAVNEAVAEAHRLAHRGAAGFVNAVLRRIARNPNLEDWPVEEREPHRRLAIEYSHPDFLVRRWIERWGTERTVRLLIANNRPKPLQLLAFRHRGGRELLAEKLIDSDLAVEPSSLSPLGLTVRHGNPLKTDAFREGEFYIQDEISQAAALLRRPEAGERILDAAAAPGGKGFALYACEPEIRLVMADVSPSRLDTLRANLRRLRLEVSTVVADAGAPPFAPVFDRVVLDLPCTGTGTFRKHPELKWRLSPDEVGRLAELGGRLLTAGASRVVPGGIVMAITCSLEAEENEAVVHSFLEENREFEPVLLEEWVPKPLERFIEAPGRWRAFPEHDHDGFTVHILCRRGASTC